MHINILRIILEQCAESRSALHTFFIGFEKAIDSVNRESIWSALFRRAPCARNCSDDTKCYVLHRCEITEEFQVQSGVRQDCILSLPPETVYDIYTGEANGKVTLGGYKNYSLLLRLYLSLEYEH